MPLLIHSGPEAVDLWPNLPQGIVIGDAPSRCPECGAPNQPQGWPCHYCKSYDRVK